MSYNGYLLKINDLTLPYIGHANVFENGSYQFNKEPRIKNEWQDISGKTHHEVGTSDRVVISFTIKDRDISYQREIEPLFLDNENIEIEYYDGFENEYKTGLFYMESKEEIVGIATQDNIYYKPIDIVFKEY